MLSAPLQLAPFAAPHVPALLRLDAACDALYLAHGFPLAAVPPRSAADLTRLAQTHAVLVALLDGAPVAFLAWRDEPPGVAYLSDLAVHPAHHRAGIATRLLARLHEQARDARLPSLAVRCFAAAPWALAFYAHHGFRPLDAAAPPPLLTWRDHRRALPSPFLRPGEIALWTAVPPLTPAR